MATIAFPFICLPDAAIWKSEISCRAKCLFSALIALRNRRTGLCNPKLATLAERLATSVSTIKRALAELRRAGMIIIQRSLWGNRYEVATPDRWKGDSFSSNVIPPDGSTVPPHSAHGWSEGTAASLYEPDVIQPDKRAAAADQEYTSPGVAATAAPLVGCNAERERPTPAAMADGETLAVELMADHPEPGNLPKAIAAAGNLLATRPDDVQRTLDVIRQNHAIWRARWATYAPGRFIPQLWRWLADGDWQHAPAERKAVQSETWLEQRERERLESDDEFYRTYAELGMWKELRSYGGDELVEVWREKLKQAS